MSTEMQDWINEIWEYCQEHWMIVAAVAAVVFILLVSFFLVLAAKRDDDAAAEEADQPETAVPESEPELLPEVPEDGGAETETLEAEAFCEAEKETVSGCLSSGDSQGMVTQIMKCVEAAGSASGQKVEAIELEIEKAKLTIRYAGTQEEVHFCGDVPAAAEPGGTCGEEAAAEQDASAEKAEDAVQENAAGESVQKKKFGAANMNTARSGRVYTEEELWNQIRD